jgi:hypothetical protein
LLKSRYSNQSAKISAIVPLNKSNINMASSSGLPTL